MPGCVCFTLSVAGGAFSSERTLLIALGPASFGRSSACRFPFPFPWGSSVTGAGPAVGVPLMAAVAGNPDEGAPVPGRGRILLAGFR